MLSKTPLIRLMAVIIFNMAAVIWPLTEPSAQATLQAIPRALPAGYFSVLGNQIIDQSGNNVRLACLGYYVPTSNYQSDLAISRAAGFNCIRVAYYDKTLDYKTIDAIVEAAAANNMRVILDHHGNEETAKCTDQQRNGLWYDLNEGDYNATNNTDGCGARGTITYAKFKANWVAIATRYARNSTVIGFDLDNEPATYANPTCCRGPQTNWGGGRGADMRAMCSDVGEAINAVNPGGLIICQGVINAKFANATQFNGVVNGLRTWTDLSTAEVNPVTGVPAQKIVYSIHSYPSVGVGGTASHDYGPLWLRSQSNAWGYLVTNNIAPVWIGELGCSCDSSTKDPDDDANWAAAMVSYVNGQQGAFGGPTFVGNQQPISTDWWMFGYNTDGYPNGILNADNSLKQGQQRFWSTLLYTVR